MCFLRYLIRVYPDVNISSIASGNRNKGPQPSHLVELKVRIVFEILLKTVEEKVPYFESYNKHKTFFIEHFNINYVKPVLFESFINHYFKNS